MSFNTSLSGINAANADLNVTANNIANVNTTGFKESRAEFADLFSYTTYGLSRNAIGTGVKISNVAQQFSQGNIDPTGRSLDFAVDGEGFFTVNKNGNVLYTRAGNFQTDSQGYVVTPDGSRLQVFAPNAGGNGFDVGRLSDLQLLATDSPPRQTESISLMVTLPGNASQPATPPVPPATVPTPIPFDPANPNSYNASSGGVTVYDSLGVAHVQTSYFVKTGNPNEWEVHNFIDGAPAGAPSLLQFSDAGALVLPADGQVAMDPYTPTTGAGVLNLTLDVTGSTQYGSTFALRDVHQDGYASGRLSEISVSEDGVVFARYSNGDDVALGQIALTTFVNPQGLQSQGNNMWGATYSSGTPRTGTPDSSDFGQIQSGALESSTVDLTEQLVNMIVAQRNFQANAQMISTQDQTTQTVLNIR
ncbi:flagellar basal-body rod protein FlgF [Pseudoxanthomonas broegbernensis]|uniref:Flagellar basal-body rod protein FlgF n=1 Tax=Pseudoxanthomonas broegbernensis TaxID=83619 RepID=A0A7V8K6Q7_9GAMM|nr:flagellar hook protein FlgE [Pseudoxanthomonas broegbernensis]KAF1685581.1 flagellar basal-body rod protein FlgF [Pseudoxanthomonas broegbernensis]MBB6065953.1 flagellar hook protein FlgE [Pseudoxanthomonas broegbernensis]